MQKYVCYQKKDNIEGFQGYNLIFKDENTNCPSGYTTSQSENLCRPIVESPSQLIINVLPESHFSIVRFSTDELPTVIYNNSSKILNFPDEFEVSSLKYSAMIDNGTSLEDFINQLQYAFYYTETYEGTVGVNVSFNNNEISLQLKDVLPNENEYIGVLFNHVYQRYGKALLLSTNITNNSILMTDLNITLQQILPPARTVTSTRELSFTDNESTRIQRIEPITYQYISGKKYLQFMNYLRNDRNRLNYNNFLMNTMRQTNDDAASFQLLQVCGNLIRFFDGILVHQTLSQYCRNQTLGIDAQTKHPNALTSFFKNAVWFNQTVQRGIA
jgi:hypothetical protein